ncbi:glycoside hydrolase [Aspergillus caelatus]|uniref:Beta-xylanase n=1 Tax=Aspergillus caelatus TaxID=61420 RepID=A0A5N7ACF3_9EURO|nr:glycoside hydrolase [Aspergillus caelatus]KAE8367534.1 glycoside hydrolase [Aspergillus caelatus]
MKLSPVRGLGLELPHASAGKLYFGTANDVGYFNDIRYITFLDDSTEVGQITPENSQKFDATEPQRGVFNFANADRVVNHALTQGQKVRCHNLVWHNGLPGWLTSGSWDRPTLLVIMENHIKNVVRYFRGRCYTWDVVNEAFNDDESYRETTWYNIIGAEYIPIAYQLTAKYDPAARLYYNDYGIESVNKKSIAAANLIKELLGQGVRVDGVGLQAHFPAIQLPDYESQMASLQQFTNLGVEVAYSELDVYFDTLRACLDTPRCVGITVWKSFRCALLGLAAIPGFRDPCLWDITYTKKGVYHGIEKMLE